MMVTQYGVLAYDFMQDGSLRFLLITSRETKRWVIPRGNPIRSLSPPQSAVQEAYEEAGLTGIVGSEEIGAYLYPKRRRDGSTVTAEVHVFPFRVTAQGSEWPERHERETKWFSREEAAAAVDEADLGRIILGFTPPSGESGEHSPIPDRDA